MTSESLPQSLLVIKTDDFGIIHVQFDGEDIRAGVFESGEIYLVAADLCKGVGIKDTSDAVSRLDDDEKGTVSVPTPGGNQDMLVVSEAGMYNLVLSARNLKPQVKAFKRRITHDIIPAIRKEGFYLSPDLTDDQKQVLLDRITQLEQKNAELNIHNVLLDMRNGDLEDLLYIEAQRHEIESKIDEALPDSEWEDD